MSLFTVEQLELVRRLKLTGMSVDKILEAYCQLDQIENELKTTEKPLPAALFADRLGSPTAWNAQAQVAQKDQQHCVLTTVPESCLFGEPLTGLTATSSSNLSTPKSISSTPVAPASSLFTPERFRFPVPTQLCNTAPNMLINSTMTTMIATQQPNTITVPSGTSARPLRPTQQQSRGGSNQRTDLVSLENQDELEEFMTQGEEFCINEMKKFITQYSLRQTTVAQMTGVSQPYISKLLNGNHRELSLRCRRNIYAWYLNCRKYPAVYCQDPSTRLETNGDGELLPQRRERYVFKPILIKILESYFSKSPFPDTQKRIEISKVCNETLQAEKKGSLLLPKEVVTPQVIANWFANKRKEMRRKSNEENRPRRLMIGIQPVSYVGSTPSPSDSSANADSPITTMLPNGLLVPLQFTQANPLSVLIQQQQNQQPTSMESLLGISPILQLGQDSEAQTPSLSELLFKSSAQHQQFQFNGLLPLTNQLQADSRIQIGEHIENPSADENNRKSLPPPLLCPMDDTEIDKSPKSLKLMSENEEVNHETDTEVQNSVTYSDLLQKLLGPRMLNLFQQPPPSLATSNTEH